MGARWCAIGLADGLQGGGAPPFHHPSWRNWRNTAVQLAIHQRAAATRQPVDRAAPPPEPAA